MAGKPRYIIKCLWRCIVVSRSGAIQRHNQSNIVHKDFLITIYMGNSFANGLKEAQYYQQDHAREYCQSVRLYAHSHANGGDHPNRSRGGQAFGVAAGVDKCAGP